MSLVITAPAIIITVRIKATTPTSIVSRKREEKRIRKKFDIIF
jgi:hypothetical protein